MNICEHVLISNSLEYIPTHLQPKIKVCVWRNFAACGVEGEPENRKVCGPAPSDL